MSADDNYPTDFISIRATSKFENDDEALEILVQMKELEFESVLPQRETSLNNKEDDGIHIGFSNDDNINQLSLSTGDEGNINITLSLIKEDISEAPQIYEKLSENIDDIDITDVDLFRKYEVPYNSLNLPIREDSELDVTGVKINHNGGMYVIQSSDTGSNVTLYARWEGLQENESEIISDIGTKQLTDADEFLQSLQ